MVISFLWHHCTGAAARQGGACGTAEGACLCVRTPRELVNAKRAYNARLVCVPRWCAPPASPSAASDHLLCCLRTAVPPCPTRYCCRCCCRLQACGPEAYDALAAENLGLKRAVAERDMYREQVGEGGGSGGGGGGGRREGAGGKAGRRAGGQEGGKACMKGSGWCWGLVCCGS